MQKIIYRNKSLGNKLAHKTIIKKENHIGLGVDYGTSNSAAALFDGESICIVKIDNKFLLPSATYLSRQHSAITGIEAINEYIRSNTGRRIELTPVRLGEARISTGQEDNCGTPQLATTHEIYSRELEDLTMPGRLLYGVKQLLADPHRSEIQIFDKQYKMEALITPLLSRIKTSINIEAQKYIKGSNSIDTVTIGHPINFEKSSYSKNDTNLIAINRLKKAFKYAGFGAQSLCSEPVGAAISYLSQKPACQNEIILVVDFGGGTLDTCILKVDDRDFEIKSVHGIGLGGNHIDRQLYKELIFPLIGKDLETISNVTEGEVIKVFNFKNYENLLLNWPTAYMLNQNVFLTPIVNAFSKSSAYSEKNELNRLLDLIQFNYSYTVLQHLKALKESLSFNKIVKLDIPELDIEIKVTRSQFSSIIHDQIMQFDLAIKTTLEKANTKPGDIDRVICVGGSSRIPAIQNILEKYFTGKVEDHDTFTSIAAGLAVHDYFASR